MKKIIYIFVSLLVTALGFQSCDYNDLEPSSSVNNPFQDLYGVEKTVNGAYSGIRLRTVMRLTEYIADDAKQGGQAGGAGTDSYAWSYSAGTGDHNDMWKDPYKVVNLANRILKFAPEVTITADADKEKLNNYLGHAYFLRAYAHFDLLRFFSDFKNENALGVPYMLEPTTFGQPERDKVSACYDNIISDLTKAKELLSEESNKNTAYASKITTDAMLARVYLYRGKYADAQAKASAVLAKVPTATAAEYADVWTDKGNAGVILKRPCFVNESRIGGIFIGQDRGNVFSPSNKYMAIYDKVRDLRANIFFGEAPDKENAIVPTVMKYIGIPETIGLNDEKLLRAEEMKLIEIEALARQDQVSEANAELNKFRAVKIQGWTNATYAKEQLLEEILLERRRELAFEGHRFFDLRRYGKDIVRDRIVDKDGKDITPILKATDYRQIMPIPLSEMDANGGIPKADQNPGY